MNQFDTKQKFVNFVFYLLLGFFVFSLLFFAIVIAYFYYLLEIKNQIYFVFNWLILIAFIFIFIYILYILEITPLILIPLISYKRTNYTGFLYETLIELQSIFIFYVVIFIQMIIHLPMYISISLLEFSIAIVLFLIVLSYKFLKKPIIQGLAFTSSNGITRTGVLDIVENQSLNVHDFQDGYSSRPLFDSLVDIFDDSYSKDEILSILSSFGKFIAINGDLISFDIQDHMVRLFFRTSLVQKTSLLNSLLQLTYLKNIFYKQNLTCIMFNLDTMEISFKLNKADYKKLDKVTFNMLATKIIARFKAGLKQFLNKNYGSVYVIINPKEDAKSFKDYHTKIRSIIYEK